MNVSNWSLSKKRKGCTQLFTSLFTFFLKVYFDNVDVMMSYSSLKFLLTLSESKKDSCQELSFGFVMISSSSLATNYHFFNVLKSMKVVVVISYTEFRKLFLQSIVSLVIAGVKVTHPKPSQITAAETILEY